MSLTSGTRLGPYEIVDKIGAGGMGEVYKATDTRLQRTIAIKVLPEHLASDPQRLARFQREAQTISSLNHPHICALHDVGDENGTHFLVMEYVEGEALDQRLESGPVPLDDALEYSKQIADALEKAHQQGIVHRDLKPANVMITKSGVKLIDFGLVHLTAASASGSPLTQMPTQGDSELTAEGTILGTFRYMAPEQVEGKDVDARTDIYALSLVIYEMITGKKAIDGKTQASLIAAILKDKPQPLTELQPITPPQLDRVVQTGLEKNPDNRWQSAREVKHALEWIGMETPSAPVPVVEVKQSPVWKVATAALAIVAIAAVWVLWPEPAPVADSISFDIGLPEGTTIGNYVRLSPDGLKVAFLTVGSRRGLWVHDLTNQQNTLLPDTTDANAPFWSPDSASIAFGDRTALRVVDIAGGNPRSVTEAGYPVGSGAWSTDDVIIFGQFGNSAGPMPLKRVPVQGGDVTDVTPADSMASASQPTFLPDGRRFIYYQGGMGGLRVGSLDVAPEDQNTNVLLRTEYGAIYVPSPDSGTGHLLYMPQDGRLMAEGFDPDSLELAGDPYLLADGVGTGGSHGRFSATPSALIYTQGGGAAQGGPVQLAWYDREPGGQVGRVGEPLGNARNPEMSADESRVTFELGDGQGANIWFADLESDGATQQLTYAEGNDVGARWSNDGQTIVFGSSREGSFDLYQLSLLANTGNEVAILSLPGAQVPQDWSSDGRHVVYRDDRGGSNDLLAIDMSSAEGNSEIPVVVNSDWEDTNAQLSPNDELIAYQSDRQQGQWQVFVQPFLQQGAPLRVSTDGGSWPRWGPQGMELFYVAPDGWLMGVEIEQSVEDGVIVLGPGAPQRLFETPYNEPQVVGQRQPYVVSGDGQRFLFMVPLDRSDGPGAAMTFRTNWRRGTEQ